MLIALCFHQETILHRAGDLAEALYSMPRNHLPPPPPQPQPNHMNGSSAFNSYSGQLSLKDQTLQSQCYDGWSHRYPTVAF